MWHTQLFPALIALYMNDDCSLDVIGACTVHCTGELHGLLYRIVNYWGLVLNIVVEFCDYYGQFWIIVAYYGRLQ